MAGRIFISIVGLNDEGKLKGEKDGAILTALKNYRKNYFNAVYLLYTENKESGKKFVRIAKYVMSEIQKRGYCEKIEITKIGLSNVIDHNEIYNKLLSICKEIEEKQGRDVKFIASIS